MCFPTGGEMKFIKNRSKAVKLPPRIEYKAAATAARVNQSGEGGERKKKESQQQRISSKSQPEVLKKNERVNDIDDIFSSIKKNKQEDHERTTLNFKGETTKESSTARLSRGMDSTHGIIKSKNQSIISPEAPLERIDKTTGLPVYKAHLLKVGEGGGTPLCPYDCDCCF
jgi:hypothetical protein